MCLDNSKRIFPKRDIKAYKVIMRDPIGGNLHSPLYGMLWEIGVVNTTKTSDADYSVYYGIHEIDYRSIGGNAFHSFRKKSDAVRYAEAIAANRNGNTAFEILVAECTIPKDSKYTYKGDVFLGGKSMDGYASQSLIIDKVISKKPFNVPNNVVYL